ncbi:MAG: hypothetical protein EBZ49_00790 [Proteobacteria bacterium]|nr:hypothetical protein [Pseudomonadota bacterium]
MFKSKSQRRKFYALKAEGKMDQKTIDEWESETPDKLPERITKKAFWLGFEKRATNYGDGGSFVAGVGKGQLPVGQMNAVETVGTADTSETMTSKELLDRDRTARDFSPHSMGPEFEDENGTHIRY